MFDRFPLAAAEAELERLGFHLGPLGPHTSRTIMFADLQELLSAVAADAGRDDYAAAIVEENVLGKKTFANRRESLRRLRELYALDPRVPLFRVFLRLWREASAGRLLDESDPTSPLSRRLASELRAALSDRRAVLDRALAETLAQLDAEPAWAELDPGQRAAVLSENRLSPAAGPGVSSDEEFLRALDDRSLATWDSEIDAVPARTLRALAAALRLAASADDMPAVPTTVSLRRGALTDEAAVRAWLREHEERLLKAVRKGPVILH